MGMTITEKIMARAAGEDSVEAGVSLRVKPDFIVAYDFPGYTDTMFAQMEQEFGIPRVQEPERYLLFADHFGYGFVVIDYLQWTKAKVADVKRLNGIISPAFTAP